MKKGPTQPFSDRIWVGSPYNPRDLCAAKDKDVKILLDFKMHPPTHPSLSQLLGNIFGNHRPEHTLSQPASPLEIMVFVFIHVTHYSCDSLNLCWSDTSSRISHCATKHFSSERCDSLKVQKKNIISSIFRPLSFAQAFFDRRMRSLFRNVRSQPAGTPI